MDYRIKSGNDEGGGPVMTNAGAERRRGCRKDEGDDDESKAKAVGIARAKRGKAERPPRLYGAPSPMGQARGQAPARKAGIAVGDDQREGMGGV